MKTRMLSAVAIAVVGLMGSALAGGGGDNCCCQHCGCQDNLNKTCRLVCEEKEIKETKYSCKCEDFCIPGPSTRCGKECESDCNSWFGHTSKWIWEPSACAKVQTRKVLVKEEVKKKVPAYKWVVEYKCGGCGNCGTIEKAVDAKTAATLAPSAGGRLSDAPSPNDLTPTAAISQR
ncbi:MAG TPA: hypothetical protein VL096_03490 [Pirellulaceae bacterium]|nr:hypothetical protein [Pirellulaceae bacterium]